VAGCMVGEWMDGWVGGCHRWMCFRVSVWLDVCWVDGCMSGLMDAIDGCVFGMCVAGCMADGWINGLVVMF